MSAALVLVAALTACLAAYSLGHYLCALVFLGARPRPEGGGEGPRDGVTVLVPARHEGERAVRAIRSLLAQDHLGPVDVRLLLKDRSDSSIPHLEVAFPGVPLGEGDEASVEISRSGLRRVSVEFTGADAKSEKVNAAVGRIETPYVALLDCDHEADPDWLRSALGVLYARGARAVQGRRAPLSDRGFFRLWDSLHQHVGCELFNAAFTRMGLTVFFTGTTAVLETELLRERPLGPCITEDIDFSYGLLMGGVRFASDPRSGSREETSPDLYSFLARRRRWASGHTEAFFRHLPALRGSPLTLVERIQFLLHGTHYLVSVLVFALHLLIGLIFAPGLAPASVGAAAGASLVLAAWIAGSQRTMGRRARVVEVAVAFGWMFPAVVIAMNLLQAVLMTDFPRAALPIPGALQVAGLVGLLAPLVVLLVGLARFRRLGVGTLLAVVATWPAAFYLDIYGVLLGMADRASGGARWRPISREGPATVAVPRSVAAVKIDRRWALAGLLLSVFGAGVLYFPTTRIDVADLACEVMEHDGDPWIVPAKRLKGYCGAADPEGPRERGIRTGSFHAVRHDPLETVDPEFWDRLDTTFFCNEAVFAPENVAPLDGGGIRLKLERSEGGAKAFTAGSIATKAAPDARYTYGRFETVMKPPKASGVVSAMFLYRFDPWQEIDMEFLGKDTTRILLNVYYNPGEEGDLYNYGYRGTPVLVDLGFDASLDFHRYAIEWEADEVRWFVDDRLIHARHAGRPTPIPHLPMRFHVNAWPCCSEELAGPFVPSDGPMGAEVRSVTISRWNPPPLARLRGILKGGEKGDWRAEARWIQP